MSRISCFRNLLPISTLALLGMLACGEGTTEPSMSPQFATPLSTSAFQNLAQSE